MSFLNATSMMGTSCPALSVMTAIVVQLKGTMCAGNIASTSWGQIRSFKRKLEILKVSIACEKISNAETKHAAGCNISFAMKPTFDTRKSACS